jgi:hypothetical protein
MPATGYTRQSSAGIIDTGIIYAALFNAEYDAIVTAFDAVNGHVHDGSAGQGGRILVLGPTGEYVASGTAFAPKASATYDLGTAALLFRDGYFSRNVAIGGTTTLTGTVSATGNMTVGGTLAVTGTASVANATTALHAINQQTGDGRYLQIAGSQTVSGSPTFTNPITVGNASAGGHAVNRTTGDARYAQLAAANTFLGGVGLNFASPAITFNRPAAGTTAGLYAQTNGVNRFALILANSTAEGGSNAGSDFRIERYNDAGTLIDNPLVLTRSTGVISLTQTPTVAGNAVWHAGNLSPMPLSGGTFTGTVTGTRFALDATGYYQLQTGNPIFAFDANDFISYDRTGNVYGLTLGGVVVQTQTATSLTLTTPVVLPADPTSALQAVTKQYAEAASGYRNKIVNGGFLVNQRIYVSGTSTAAGTYMHDRWKAGAAGCQYTFTQSGGPTTSINIASGSLMQVIEGLELVAGNYILSWTGTAQARINGGAYGSSPMTANGITQGSNVVVEFGPGSLGTPQFEKSVTPTPFEVRPVNVEVGICQRFFCIVRASVRGTATGAGSTFDCTVAFPTAMRAQPSVSLLGAGSRNLVSSANLYPLGGQYGRFELVASGGGDAYVIDEFYNIVAEL